MNLKNKTPIEKRPISGKNEWIFSLITDLFKRPFIYTRGFIPTSFELDEDGMTLQPTIVATRKKAEHIAHLFSVFTQANLRTNRGLKRFAKTSRALGFHLRGRYCKLIAKEKPDDNGMENS